MTYAEVMQQFDQFWRAYPRRMGKANARKAFEKAIKQGATLGEMLDALKWQCQQPGWLKDGGSFIPYPASWLNAERWHDEPFEAPQISERTARTLGAIYGTDDVTH
jgi:hypothetical protein